MAGPRREDSPIANHAAKRAGDGGKVRRGCHGASRSEVSDSSGGRRARNVQGRCWGAPKELLELLSRPPSSSMRGSRSALADPALALLEAIIAQQARRSLASPATDGAPLMYFEPARPIGPQPMRRGLPRYRLVFFQIDRRVGPHRETQVWQVWNRCTGRRVFRERKPRLRDGGTSFGGQPSLAEVRESLGESLAVCLEMMRFVCLAGRRN